MTTQRLRQGDTFAHIVEKIPVGATPIKNKPIAYGEIHGHAHCVTGDVQMFEFEGKIYVTVGSDGASYQHIHESSLTESSWKSSAILPVADHPHIELKPNTTYQFTVQNFYNPYTKALEAVRD